MGLDQLQDRQLSAVFHALSDETRLAIRPLGALLAGSGALEAVVGSMAAMQSAALEWHSSDERPPDRWNPGASSGYRAHIPGKLNVSCRHFYSRESHAPIVDVGQPVRIDSIQLRVRAVWQSPYAGADRGFR